MKKKKKSNTIHTISWTNLAYATRLRFFFFLLFYYNIGRVRVLRPALPLCTAPSQFVVVDPFRRITPAAPTRLSRPIYGFAVAKTTTYLHEYFINIVVVTIRLSCQSGTRGGIKKPPSRILRWWRRRRNIINNRVFTSAPSPGTFRFCYRQFMAKKKKIKNHLLIFE